MSNFTLPPLNSRLLMRQFGIHAKKALGQNFLQEEPALAAIAKAADIQTDDEILEIGPGLGSLTRHLALASRFVTAVELDEQLFPALETVIAPYQNVRLIHGDILKMDPISLVDMPGYLVVANIPYYITSVLLRHLLESACRPRRLVLTIQKEVAERICSTPGKLNLLALSVQVFGIPEIVTYVPAAAFFPTPKVDSAILRIEILPEPVIPPPLLDTFFKLIKAGFSQKRKTLRNSLSHGIGVSHTRANNILTASNIDPMRRAETLSLDEWRNLCQVVIAESTFMAG